MTSVRRRWAVLPMACLVVALAHAATEASGNAAVDPKSSSSAAGVSADAAANVRPVTTALLNANGCLGCHGINQKIVGPSYHEVALKYRGQSDAAGKLAESIRNGGSGRWGQVPMPPFMQLSLEELHSLADFVLAQ